MTRLMEVSFPEEENIAKSLAFPNLVVHACDTPYLPFLGSTFQADTEAFFVKIITKASTPGSGIANQRTEA